MNRFREVYLIGWLLAGCAAYSAGVLYTADARAAARLAAAFPPHWPLPTSPPAAFDTLRLVLAGGAAGLALLGVVLARRFAGQARAAGRFRPPKEPLPWRGLLRGWRALLPRQRHLALATLVALTAVRVIVSRELVTFDDSASYEYFVRKSLLVVSATYPAPNNHVLSNTLSWLFYQLYPGFWWSMRVPVLLLSTAGTVGWFLGLLRGSNFRVAALAVTLFSFLEMSLFYAAEGRGYALLLVLSGLGFFSVLALTAPAAATPPAWAWVGLAAAGILGLYTVPTFAYFLVAAYSWLGCYWLRQARYARLGGLSGLGAATLLGAALLYAPLLLVSGAQALFQNKYLQPLAVSAFFRQLPAYVWETEGGLLGESHNGVLASLHVGSLAAVAVLIGFGALVVAARRGRLSAPQAAYVLRLGVPALWFAVLPYALLLGQRVQAPGRTLLFKGVFLFVLIGLEANWLLHHARLSRRLVRLGLLLGVGLWVGVQLVQLYRSNELRLSYLGTPRRVARWLLRQPPGPILLPGSPWDAEAIRFYLHAEEPTSLLTIDEAPRPGVRYRYRISSPAEARAPAAAAQPGLHIDRGINHEALDVTAYW